MTVFKHYTDVPPTAWKWPHFKPSEIACRDNGELLINADALDRLEVFRKVVGVPFTPNSAYRSAVYNKLIGGSPNSMHLQGRAFDVPIKPGMTREQIHAAARQAGFTGFGDYNTFVHIDTGPARTWDNRK